MCRCPHTSVVQLNLSLSGKPGHSPLSSQNWKPTSSLLPTDLSLSFFCFHQTHDYYACVFAVCVCVCAHMCVWVCVVFVYVCACVCVACLSAFVSTLGSHEMGCHKLPIIIIIKTWCSLNWSGTTGDPLHRLIELRSYCSCRYSHTAIVVWSNSDSQWKVLQVFLFCHCSVVHYRLKWCCSCSFDYACVHLLHGDFVCSYPAICVCVRVRV